MSRDQNAERSHNMKTENRSFERWTISNIWEQHQQIKILFKKKIRAD